MPKIKEEKPISIEEYRSEAKRVDGVLEKASAAFGRAKEENNLSEARQWCDTLSTSADELRGLRARLSPRDLFIVQYNIEVINNHAISLVIPRGVSRKEVVHEAQEFLREHHGMAAIEPSSLEHWMILRRRCASREVVSQKGTRTPFATRLCRRTCRFLCGDGIGYDRSRPCSVSRRCAGSL
jgi:hypothetical protein